MSRVWLASKVPPCLKERPELAAPFVTEISAAGSFYAAEDYHQDYLVKHPNGYTCHYLRDE